MHFFDSPPSAMPAHAITGNAFNQTRSPFHAWPTEARPHALFSLHPPPRTGKDLTIRAGRDGMQSHNDNKLALRPLRTVHERFIIRSPLRPSRRNPNPDNLQMRQGHRFTAKPRSGSIRDLRPRRGVDARGRATPILVCMRLARLLLGVRSTSVGAPHQGRIGDVYYNRTRSRAESALELKHSAALL